MSNYLKIIFKCDLILQIFFLIILGGRGGPFSEVWKKILEEKTPPSPGGGGTIFRRNSKLSMKLVRVIFSKSSYCTSDHLESIAFSSL